MAHWTDWDMRIRRLASLPFALSYSVPVAVVFSAISFGGSGSDESFLGYGLRTAVPFVLVTVVIMFLLRLKGVKPLPGLESLKPLSKLNQQPPPATGPPLQ